MSRGQTIIYPGSFDPPTNGHLDLIVRAAARFDRIVVAVLKNEGKTSLFTVDERIDMLRKALTDTPNVEIDSFRGLLVHYAKSRDVNLILRGIRAVSDYEYELQMALMNRHLMPDLETIFMLPGEAYSYISSRLVKEVARLGGDIGELVPPHVAERLRERAKR